MINNKLLNTIGEMDDRHIRAEEFNSLFEKRKTIKKLAVFAVAAAALATLSMIVGFRVNHEVSGSIMGYQVKNSEPVIFDPSLKAKELKISDEIIAQFEDDHYSCKEAPDKLYETFGVEPLINENFILYNRFIHDNPESDMARIAITRAYGIAGYYRLNYQFSLRNVNTGDELAFEEVHFSDPERYGMNVGVIKFEEDDIFEVLTLNDGSPCIAWSDSAYFAYNGSLYRFFMLDDEEEPSTLEKVKTILSDLGVL